MKEEFVTYEIAKKLEAKGMGNDGNYGYNDKGEICIPVYNLDDDQVKAMCPCPQIHEVLKWLRDEKKLYISIEPHSNDDFSTKIMWTWDAAYINSDCKFQWYDGEFGFDSYEKAAVSAIEYVIDKLI